jgi:hypothetical protein
LTQLYLKEKTKIYDNRDITTDTILKCLKMVNFETDSTGQKSISKHLQYKLYILMYVRWII